MEKLRAGILGATGRNGQEFIEALDGHPWFQVTELFASKRSAGKPYREACSWNLQSKPPELVLGMNVKDADDINPDSVDVFFSAVEEGNARELEEYCAQFRPVFSTTSAFRYDKNVPILVLEVNGAEHSGMRRLQQKGGRRGYVLPGPNCTTNAAVIAVTPILEKFGIARMVVSSYQAVSGAGQKALNAWKPQRTTELPYASEELEAQQPVFDGNVIIHIDKEQQKVRAELLKILGTYEDGRIVDAGFKVGCKCIRVPVVDGHTESIFVETLEPCGPEDLRKAYTEFDERCRSLYGDLPSSPERFVCVYDNPSRPQPRLDVNRYRGMATHIGQIEASTVFERGVELVALSHNSKKGGALGSLQVAEFIYKSGL